MMNSLETDIEYEDKFFPTLGFKLKYKLIRSGDCETFLNSIAISNTTKRDTRTSEVIIRLKATSRDASRDEMNKRLTEFNQEVINYQPDLIVLATGHNEFLENRTFNNESRQTEVRSALESLRLVVWLRNLLGHDVDSFKESSGESLPENVTARLDEESGYASYHWDPDWKEQVTKQYKESLEIIIQQCKSSDTPLILVCLGSNLRDCPPFKSELPTELSPQGKQQFLDLFAQATDLADQPEAALNRYEQCLEISDQYALLHYRLGRTHELLGDPVKARQHYLLAKDLDICPLRLS